MKTFNTLLRERTHQGNRLVALWVHQDCVISAEENRQLNKEIEKAKNALRIICHSLADHDAEYGASLYRAYLDYLDKKAQYILDELD